MIVVFKDYCVKVWCIRFLLRFMSYGDILYVSSVVCKDTKKIVPISHRNNYFLNVSAVCVIM